MNRGSLAGSARSNLTLDPSGEYLFVASQDADCVECFRIDHPAFI